MPLIINFAELADDVRSALSLVPRLLNETRLPNSSTAAATVTATAAVSSRAPIAPNKEETFLFHMTQFIPQVLKKIVADDWVRLFEFVMMLASEHTGSSRLQQAVEKALSQPHPKPKSPEYKTFVERVLNAKMRANTTDLDELLTPEKVKANPSCLLKYLLDNVGACKDKQRDVRIQTIATYFEFIKEESNAFNQVYENHSYVGKIPAIKTYNCYWLEEKAAATDSKAVAKATPKVVAPAKEKPLFVNVLELAVDVRKALQAVINANANSRRMEDAFLRAILLRVEKLLDQIPPNNWVALFELVEAATSELLTGSPVLQDAIEQALNYPPLDPETSQPLYVGLKDRIFGIVLKAGFVFKDNKPLVGFTVNASDPSDLLLYILAQEGSVNALVRSDRINAIAKSLNIAATQKGEFEAFLVAEEKWCHQQIPELVEYEFTWSVEISSSTPSKVNDKASLPALTKDSIVSAATRIRAQTTTAAAATSAASEANVVTTRNSSLTIVG